ncbi:sulfite exporter TauE/SafE family protein [Endozoicomonas lisbonensis]|uniref:Probable membrane transporter protein n=1 Tax=Endozoicomonas lisbonensis TaxID=3120522 RepID=A0ABV2SLB9_9GAMM
MDFTVFELITVFVAIFFGALVQGTIGFGLAIVAAPVLYLVTPELVPGSIILMAMLVGGLTAKQNLHAVKLNDLKSALMGRIPGSLLGAMLLTMASHRTMGLFMGGSVLFAVLASLSPYKVQTNGKTLFSAGLLSGIMGTASSIGGPPMALVMQNQSGERIRANLSAYFVVSAVISLSILAWSGQFGWLQLKYGLMFVPCVLAGNLVARKLVPYVDQAMIRKALLMLCSVAGIGAIVSAI